jgi:hypothetical protein
MFTLLKTFGKVLPTGVFKYLLRFTTFEQRVKLTQHWVKNG